MEILPKSHRTFNIASKYSQNIIDKFSNERIKCFGPKGTVYMHTGNVFHRLNPVAGKNRVNLHFEFSPGSNILLDVQNIKKCLNSNYNIENLERKKEIFSKSYFLLKKKKDTI